MVVEDEVKIREMIKLYLEHEGYQVMDFDNGIDALNAIEEFKPHLTILDIMMPGISGWDVLNEIRELSTIPVIMLTALTEEGDRLKGFDCGADDYVCKPFSVKEIVKRVNVFIDRVYNQKKKKEIIVYKELELNVKNKQLYKHRINIPLTSREYNIVYVFFNNIAQPLTRDQIIEKAIGHDYDGFDRNIDAIIKNIRHKIEDNTRKPQYIKTKYGYGYVFGE